MKDLTRLLVRVPLWVRALALAALGLGLSASRAEAACPGLCSDFGCNVYYCTDSSHCSCTPACGCCIPCESCHPDRRVERHIYSTDCGDWFCVIWYCEQYNPRIC